jgi:hypothetical protein
MARFAMLTIALVGSFTLTGCMGVQNLFQPSVMTAGPGLIITDVQGGTLVLDNGTTPTKSGEACSTEILGIVAQGDNRIETAMTNGGIKKVVFVHHSIKSYVFGVYAMVCTLVRGV